MILPMSLHPMFPRFPVVMFSCPHALPLLPMFLPCSFPKLISRLSQPLRDRSIRQRGNGSGVWGSVLLLLLLGPPTPSLALGHIMPRCVHLPHFLFPSPPPLRIFSTPSHLPRELPAAALDDTTVLYIQIPSLFSNYNITFLRLFYSSFTLLCSPTLLSVGPDSPHPAL